MQEYDRYEKITKCGPVTVDFKDGEFTATVGKHGLKYGAEKAWSTKFKPVDGIIPSEYLVVSVGGCAAMHAVIFLQKERLPTEGVKLNLYWRGNAQQGELLNTIFVDVKVEPKLTKDQEAGLIEEVAHCTVLESIKQFSSVKVNVL
jgi:uncharacterized OsmC-like protein